MKLYEIDNQIQHLLDMQWEQDLSDEDIKDTLEHLLMDKHDKCVNIALALKNLKKDIEAFKAEEERLNKKRRSMEKQTEWLKNYLAFSLNGEKIEDDPRVSVRYGTSKELIIDSPSFVPEQYLIKQEPKVDKKGLKEAIQNGETYQGIRIQENKYLVVK